MKVVTLVLCGPGGPEVEEGRWNGCWPEVTGRQDRESPSSSQGEGHRSGCGQAEATEREEEWEWSGIDQEGGEVGVVWHRPGRWGGGR